MRPTRVLVVDDDPFVRSGLRAIIESADDLVVVGEAADGAQAIDAVAAHAPDVVLMDVRMPRVNGIDATARICAQRSPPRVLVLTTFDLDRYVVDALRAGASGFLLKDAGPHGILDAIRVVAAGNALLSPTATRTLIDRFADPDAHARRSDARARLSRLTERELETAALVGEGLTNTEIGRRLGIAEASVKANVSRTLTKLEVTNRVQVALLVRDARP